MTKDKHYLHLRSTFAAWLAEDIEAILEYPSDTGRQCVPDGFSNLDALAHEYDQIEDIELIRKIAHKALYKPKRDLRAAAKDLRKYFVISGQVIPGRYLKY